MTSIVSDAHLKIQETLEKGTPLLNELVFKKWFTREEVQAVVTKRTDFEHKLRQTAKGGTPKSIYLQYLEQEINFTSAVLVRGKVYREAVREQKKQQIKEQKLSRQEAIALAKQQNKATEKLKYFGKQLVFVYELFEKSLHHFPSDLSLWKSFIDFCIRFQFRAGPALEQACLKIPTQSQLWILSAHWYLDYQLEPETARNILRRAIKINKNSSAIWLEYFKLEIKLAWVTEMERQDRLRELKAKQQSEKAAADAAAAQNDEQDDQEDEEEEEDAFDDDGEIMMRPKLSQNSKKGRLRAAIQDAGTVAASAVSAAKDDNIELPDPKELYEIPWTIYEQVIASREFSRDSALRFSMLEALAEHPHCAELQNKMLQELLVEFSGDPNVVFRVLTFKHKSQQRRVQQLRSRRDKLEAQHSKDVARLQDMRESKTSSDAGKKRLARTEEELQKLERKQQSLAQQLELSQQQLSKTQLETIAAIERYLAFSNDSRLRLLFIQLLERFVEHAESEEQTQVFVARLAGIYSDLKRTGSFENVKIWSSDVLGRYARFLCQTGRPQESLSLLQSVLTQGSSAHQADDKLWLQYLRLLETTQDSKSIDSSIMLEAIDQATKSHMMANQKNVVSSTEDETGPSADSSSLFETQEQRDARNARFWSSLMPIVITHCRSSETVGKYFKQALRECVRLHSIKQQYLDWSLMASTASENLLKRAVEDVLSLPPHKEDTLKTLIRYVKLYLAHEEQLLVKLLQRSILEFGQTNADFWLEYIAYYRDAKKQPTKAQSMYDQAVKTLRKPDEFIAKYYAVTGQSAPAATSK